ncbi:MAG: hypothetical protein ACI9XZ_002557 [Alphaproteobacteria bacterium]|jgi:hypothetical protein
MSAFPVRRMKHALERTANTETLSMAACGIQCKLGGPHNRETVTPTAFLNQQWNGDAAVLA